MQTTTELANKLKNKQCNVAVVGATGAVGREMVKILHERSFPFAKLQLLASERSAGEMIEEGSNVYTVALADDFDFSGIDIALFSAGSSVSKKLEKQVTEAGCLIIDNSSCFRYQDDVPLIVPEVNPHALGECRKRMIIANPNCSTIQLVAALAPLDKQANLVSLKVATYQAVSGAGQKGIEELADQSRNLLSGEAVEPSVFPTQIGFNAIPHIDTFLDNDYTKEEMKIVWETRKIMQKPDLAICATAVRIPVFFAHSEVVHAKFAKPISPKQAEDIFNSQGYLQVINRSENGGYPTAVEHGSRHDEVFIGRIRRDISEAGDDSLVFWVVADNIRKGAALNAVQIAELYLAYEL